LKLADNYTKLASTDSCHDQKMMRQAESPKFKIAPFNQNL